MQRRERKFTARRSNPYPADVILASAASSATTEIQETPSPTQERSSILSSFAKFFTNLIPTTWLSRKSVQSSSRETTLSNESRLDEEFSEQPQVDEEYVDQILKLYPQASPEEIRMASSCPSLWQIVHDAVEAKKQNIGNYSRIANTDLGLSTNATVHSEFNNDIISIEDEDDHSKLKSSSLGMENKTPTDVVRSMIKGTSSNHSGVSSQQQNRAPQSAFNFPTSPIKTSGEDSQHNGHFSNTIYPIPKKRLLFPGSLSSQKKELLNPHIVRGNVKKDTTTSKRSHESFEPQKSNIPPEAENNPTKRVKHLYPQGAKTYSETAKRILETLDQLSSPLIDVEKVPPKPLAMRLSTVERTQSKLRKSTSQPHDDEEDVIPSSSMTDVVSTSKVESRKKEQAPLAEKKEVTKPEKPVKTAKFATSVDEATPIKRKHIVRKDSTPYARKSKQAEPVEEEEEEEEETFEEATREKREKLSQVPSLSNFLPPSASINFTFNSTKPSAATTEKLVMNEKPKDIEMKEITPKPTTTTTTTSEILSTTKPAVEQKKEIISETKETPKEELSSITSQQTKKPQQEKPSFSFNFLTKPSDPAVKKPEALEPKKDETTISTAVPVTTKEPQASTSIPDESDRSITPVSISSSSEEEEEAPKEPSGFKFTFPTGGVSFPSASATIPQKEESKQEKVEEKKSENVERPKFSSVFSSFISQPEKKAESTSVIPPKSPETTTETSTATGFNFAQPSALTKADSEKPQTNGGFVFTATQPTSSAPSFGFSTKATEEKKDESVTFKPPTSSISFSFGPPKTTEEKKELTWSGGLNFGGAFVPQKSVNPPTETKEEKKDTTETTGLKFGGSTTTPSFSVTPSPPEKKDEPTSFTPSFSFGGSTSTKTTSDTNAPISFSFGSSSSDKPTSSGISFSFGGANIASSAPTTTTPVNFSFGSSASKEEPAKPLEDKSQTEQPPVKPAFSGISFSFNKPTSSTDNTSTGSGGSLTEKASTSVPTSFSFGSIPKPQQSDSSSTTPTSNVGFSFGATSTGAASPPTSVTSADSKPPTSFAFGSTSSDTPASNEVKSSFSFGGSSIQTTAIDASKTFSSGGFTFGAKPAAQEVPSSGATQNKFVFGAPSNQPPSTGFSFAIPNQGTTFSFGSVSSQPTTTTPSFGGNSMLEDDSAMHQSGMNFPSSATSFTQPAAFSAITPTTPSISPFGPPQTNAFSSGMPNPFNASSAQPEFPDQRKPIKAIRRRK
ncbi:hypothetical protein FDP41_000404 [Naegleria fowleri]|uniref:Uncharacterized protein n=1 Tax=Naegleria fowleri TaxID=5763 RepID=A0A6A5CGU9_NAEFO|nr:uncharacterized protein FDP41_000404 [Naegleria fowleri]KAF0984505.1 hypothetical protein FDP41_000404 [Naegleria fowleri]